MFGFTTMLKIEFISKRENKVYASEVLSILQNFTGKTG